MRRPIASTALVLLMLAAAPAAFTQTAAATRAPVQQPALKQQSSPPMRSAQGDCVREVNRRGFTVLETGNFRQMQDGWSIDLRVRDSRGRIQQGSCFVETRTGDVDLYGFGWGWDDEGDDHIEFNCASVESKYRECQLPINGRARLVKKRSDAPCIEGRTWGQRGDRIWVKDGCRARFQVERFGSGGGSGGASTIDCFSEDGRYRECRIGSGRYARLQRDYSNGRCRADRTWGNRNGVLWVTDGCRGRFEIQRGGTSDGGSGGSGGTTGSAIGQAEAKNACAREVTRRGYQVVKVGDVSSSGNRYRLNLRVRQGSSSVERAVGCQVNRSTGAASISW